MAKLTVRSMEYSPEEKVYPLNYTCQYVMNRKEEVVGKECESMESLHDINRNIAEARKQVSLMAANLAELKGNKGVSEEVAESLTPYVASLLGEISQTQRNIESIMSVMTEKSLMFEDITNMLGQMEPLIVRLMYQDNLTCAYNRYFYITHEKRMYESAQGKEGMSMAFVDIDDFKQFNTAYGHEFGDVVLQQFSTFLASQFRKNENLFLVRMGGDEFVIIGTNIVYPDFVKLIGRICREVSRLEIDYGGQTAGISISVGAANATADHTSGADALYRLSDGRLYRAKDAGKNGVVWNDSDIDEG